VFRDGALMRICSFSDPQDYRITVAGKVFRFDFSQRFGPLFVDANGRELSRQPGPKREVWKAVTYWLRQGKRVGEDGLCIWDYPRPTTLIRCSLRGRTAIVVGRIEPDGTHVLYPDSNAKADEFALGPVG